MSDKKEIISASPKIRKLAREFGADIYKIKFSQLVIFVYIVNCE